MTAEQKILAKLCLAKDHAELLSRTGLSCCALSFLQEEQGMRLILWNILFVEYDRLKLFYIVEQVFQRKKMASNMKG